MGQGTNGQQISGPPEWLQQPIQSYLGAAGQEAGKPYETYQGMRVAPFTNLQNQAFQGIGASMYGTPATTAAASSLASILSGGSNPELDNVIQRSQRGVTDAYNDAVHGTTRLFNTGNAFGSSAHQAAMRDNQEALATGLGDVESGLRYQDFTGNLNRQLQAAPLAMQNAQGLQGLYSGGLQAGNLQQGYGQALVDSQYGDWQGSQQHGWNQLGQYGNALSRALGGAGTQQTVTEPNNPWSNALGLGLLGYGMFNK